MSVTLATMADSLIEFILSLLRDPAAAAEFEEDPDGALAQRGLSNVSHADVCSVAPVIAERPAVIPTPPTPGPAPKPTPDHHDPVIREIKNITHNFAWVDDRDTIIDQSVNQNIWANGDVTQVFDNEAITASGDGAIAAGDDVDLDQTVDNSTDINAGEDVNIGNDTDTSIVDGSYNEDTSTETNTDSSTDTTVTDSGNDSSTNVDVDDSFNSSAASYTETDVDVDANAAFATDDTVIVDDVSADDTF
jgi:hypothetical protein